VDLVFINFYILSSKITILTFSAASLLVPRESAYISGASVFIFCNSLLCYALNGFIDKLTL